MRFSRDRSCSVEMPGSTRCSSTKRRGPATRSRTISSVHLSPTRSKARASGAHWLYGCRLGGGTEGMAASRETYVEVERTLSHWKVYPRLAMDAPFSGGRGRPLRRCARETRRLGDPGETTWRTDDRCVTIQGCNATCSAGDFATSAPTP